MLDNTSSAVCIKDPILMLSVVDMLNQQIINLAPGVLSTDAVNLGQVAAIQNNILTLITENSTGVDERFNQVLAEVRSINGMSEQAVSQLIQQALSTQYDNATIDNMITAQAGGLISGLQAQMQQLQSRLETLEGQVAQGADLIAALRLDVDQHQADIASIQVWRQQTSVLIQNLLTLNQPASFIVVNGLATSAIGLDLNAQVQIDCGKPGDFIAFTVTSKKSDVLEPNVFAVVSGRKIAARSAYSLAELTPAELEQGYTFGQKIRIQLPDVGEYHVHLK